MKKVFVSYRYKDRPRFDVVRDIAARLRFFSIEVILDQRSLLFGEDIKDFMAKAIQEADALVILLSEDYNEVLDQHSGPGEGVRYEVRLALQERDRRPAFRIVPILLDSGAPVPPFDRLKCARPTDIDEIITELGLVEHLTESRVLAQRYRVDRLIETRGFARIFDGHDLVVDAPVQIYMVPAAGETGLQGERFRLFERVLKGRSLAFSPFLLNIRDSYLSADGAYYLVTEQFEGTDLSVPLNQRRTTHPFGALSIAYQVALGLYELHIAGVVHGGLAPRAIRHNAARTQCKLIDFEFARPTDMTEGAPLDGYPLITPPERFHGGYPSVQQDIYQLANLVFWLIAGFPVVSREFPQGARLSTVFTEDPSLHGRLASSLREAVSHVTQETSTHPDLVQSIARTTTNEFLDRDLSQFLARCLNPDPASRPKCLGETLSYLTGLGIPPAGRLLDHAGREVPGALIPEYGMEQKA
ncbi:MAG: TIR domain-containing protein [Pirellulales bacterium]|nr:TIR domain-containing protein [Pirellulales bacterium]